MRLPGTDPIRSGLVFPNCEHARNQGLRARATLGTLVADVNGFLATDLYLAEPPETPVEAAPQRPPRPKYEEMLRMQLRAGVPLLVIGGDPLVTRVDVIGALDGLPEFLDVRHSHAADLRDEEELALRIGDLLREARDPGGAVLVLQDLPSGLAHVLTDVTRARAAHESGWTIIATVEKPPKTLDCTVFHGPPAHARRRPRPQFRVVRSAHEPMVLGA